MREKPLPTPLVTMALFMMPMVTSKMAVMTDDRTPDASASAIFFGPMATGSNMPFGNAIVSRLVAQDVPIKAAIAQQAAKDGVTPESSIQIMTVSGITNTSPPEISLPLSTVMSISDPASYLTASIRTTKATDKK